MRFFRPVAIIVALALLAAAPGTAVVQDAPRLAVELLTFIGFGLATATGALFSTVGSGYILQSGLPPTTEFSLADAFQITSFFVTFLTMLLIYVVHVLSKRRLWKAALTTGRVLVALHIVSVVWIVYLWLAVSG